MNKRDFAFYVMNQLEHRYYGGERDRIISWLNDFAQTQDEIAQRTGDAMCADNAVILRSMRDAYLADGMNGCQRYLRESL